MNYRPGDLVTSLVRIVDETKQNRRPDPLFPRPSFIRARPGDQGKVLAIEGDGLRVVFFLLGKSVLVSPEQIEPTKERNPV